MQTYIVLVLVGLAAGYVAYVLLRRLGLLGAPLGCACCGEGGCASSGRATETERETPVSQQPPAAPSGTCQGCCGCASSTGGCGGGARLKNSAQD